MNPELRQVLDNLPADEPRSRLEPYREVILRWRRQGRSYRRMQKLLTDHCAIQVSTSMLFKFVKSRSRPRKPHRETEPQPPRIPSEPEQMNQLAVSGLHPKLLPAEAARQRALLQALREKPVVIPDVRKRFVYDPDEPLILGQALKD
jgi:hypothetical protein